MSSPPAYPPYAGAQPGEPVRGPEPGVPRPGVPPLGPEPAGPPAGALPLGPEPAVPPVGVLPLGPEPAVPPAGVPSLEPGPAVPALGPEAAVPAAGLAPGGPRVEAPPATGLEHSVPAAGPEHRGPAARPEHWGPEHGLPAAAAPSDPALAPYGYAGYPRAYAYPEPDRLTRWVTRLWGRLPVWAAPLGALACMGAAAAYTEISHPAAAGAGDAPTCLLKYTTGFDCPGCGGTRAAWYLLHGNLPAAARHHAVFVFAVPFLLYIYLAWAGRRLFGWRLPQLTLTPRAIGIFLAVWGVWSVLRNLPWAPFTYFYV
jgi:hypothetical protein